MKALIVYRPNPNDTYYIDSFVAAFDFAIRIQAISCYSDWLVLSMPDGARVDTKSVDSVEGFVSAIEKHFNSGREVARTMKRIRQ